MEALFTTSNAFLPSPGCWAILPPCARQPHTHCCCLWHGAVLWWLYQIAFGEFPISWSLQVYHLFTGITAGSAAHWLLILLVPLACIMPDGCYRAMRRWVRAWVWVGWGCRCVCSRSTQLGIGSLITWTRGLYSKRAGVLGACCCLADPQQTITQVGKPTTPSEHCPPPHQTSPAI